HNSFIQPPLNGADAESICSNFCFCALSNAKPLRTFAGNALSLRIIQRKTASHFCWKCSVSTHYPTQNRFALLLEMLEYTNSVQDRYSPHSRKGKNSASVYEGPK